MKAFKVVVCLAAVMTVAPLVAQAQTEVLQVNVPFDFVVGKALLPAGHYEVKQTFTPDQVVISDQRHSAMFRTESIQSSAGTGHAARLLFKNVNGRFALAEVWGTDQTFGRAVPVDMRTVTTRMAKVDVVEVKAGQ